jgi:BirA family transcriptional regulator, biotin operon repressor / biotin---[acetyl-CoA-carboxylase] ligase
MTSNLKLLIQILSDGQFHSGTELGKTLNITRSAIWKLIKRLDKYGIETEAKTNRGYRIPQGLELLDKQIIGANLGKVHQHYLKTMTIFDELPSTNTYLTELDKASPINICLAESQTAGKGRLGRTWISPFARNIYLSLSWIFFQDPKKLSGLSLVVAIATLEALKIYGIEKGLGLKWPNDLLWKNHKLAGMLIELSGEANHFYKAVIGIGINVQMSERHGQKIDQHWCDIAKITKTIPQRNRLIGILLEQLFTSLTIFQEHGFKTFLEKWPKYDIYYNRPIKIITQKDEIAGVGQGIDEKGHFLLKDDKGKIHSFACGEVSLRYIGQNR